MESSCPSIENLTVGELMTNRLVTVALDDTLYRVRDIFAKTRFHHLLVVGEGRLFGVLSDRDLLKAISPNLGTVSETQRDAATLNKRVHQVMTRKPVVLPPQATVEQAISIFDEKRVSCIPIADEHMKPMGILSWRDLLKHCVVYGRGLPA